MIAVLKQGTTPEQTEYLINWLRRMDLQVHKSEMQNITVLGLIGDTAHVDPELLKSLEIVDTVKRISEPFKQSNRKFHPNDTIVQIGNIRIGGGYFATIAGPCSVESEEQIIGIAKAVKESGADILRGGAFKPRTSPYAFQGMKGEGIRLLELAKAETGMPIITEIMNINDLPLYEHVDVIQVGARNMQNFDLLKELGRTKVPILLKRGLSNTLDLSAVASLHHLSHLPVVVDPSHATGKAHLVPSMALAAAAAGADGIMVEVHNNPGQALCDGAQSITPDQFQELNQRIRRVREAIL